MLNRKKVLAISGSIRQNSLNLSLLKEIAKLSTEIFEVRIFEGLGDIPHFNSDLDTDTPPAEVIDFRRQVKEADGILICTPEYAMGVPGVLKDAIDWTVSSAEFSHKPVALITASSSGQKGHLSLLETLRIIECDIPDGSQLLISFVKTKVSSEGKILDLQTLEQVKKLVNSLNNTIEESNG